MNELAVTQSNLTEQKDLIEFYLSSLDVKPRSKDTYRKALKQFMQFVNIRNIDGSISRTDILAYKNHLTSKYKASTVSSYLSAVKGLFTFLEAEKIMPNVANGIKGAKAQEGFRKDPLTVDQVKDVLSSLDTSTTEGKRNFALINLLIRTGLRTIEISRANIKDIRQQGGEALLYIQGKGHDSKDAFVVLTQSTLKPIKDYLISRGATKEMDPLFASLSDRNNGGRLTTRSISRIVKEQLKKAGLDDERLTAHSLRHTAVTLALLSGATVQEAQSMARHKNIQTTLIYAHNINRVKQAPERKIDALLAQ